METSYKGTDKMITGIVFGVITFWLFAQAMVNVVPAVQKDLGITSGTLNIAISLTALFSGMFIVAAGGIADKIGPQKNYLSRVNIKRCRFPLPCISARIDIVNYRTYHSRTFRSLYYAINDCPNESLL